MKKNEKLYFHGNGGFEQVDNKGRIENEEKILPQIRGCHVKQSISMKVMDSSYG